MHIKKIIILKNRIVFNLIFYLSNNELLVIDNPFLDILKIIEYININSETIQVKLELIKKLFKKSIIKEFNLLFSLKISFNIFFFKCKII